MFVALQETEDVLSIIFSYCAKGEYCILIGIKGLSHVALQERSMNPILRLNFAKYKIMENFSNFLRKYEVTDRMAILKDLYETELGRPSGNFVIHDLTLKEMTKNHQFSIVFVLPAFHPVKRRISTMDPNTPGRIMRS
jgi:hypothetical protein